MKEEARSFGSKRHISRETVQLVVVDILADLAPELCDAAVGTVLHELMEHALADTRDAENVILACRVEIDGDENVLL